MSCLLVAGGLKTSQEPWLPCSITRCIVFGFAYLLNQFFKRVGTERVQEEQFMKTPNRWESVWNALKKAGSKQGWWDFFDSVQFSSKLVTVDTVVECPDAALCATTTEKGKVSSSKFQQEVNLGRHMCLCVCLCACVCVCVTNNRLQGNCRGLQWLWAGPRHHPSIWRWGWIQFDIPVCLCLHHYGLKLAGSDRLRRQVAWCRRGSLRLYFRVKCWLYTMHYM